MMLIGYKTMDKEMMDMVTVVVHHVTEVLVIVVMVVWLVEDEARLCTITVTRKDI